VQLYGRRIDIRAGIHTLGGFSAHADQKDLLNFVSRMPQPPRQVRIVHGDDGAKATLAQRIKALSKNIETVIP
jgi:metallo-beta-lactamase family protein